MGTATGSSCFIRKQTFEEYTGNDQMDDGRTTKNTLWKSSKYFKRSSYVNAGPCGLQQLALDLSNDQGTSDLANLEARDRKEV